MTSIDILTTVKVVKYDELSAEDCRLVDFAREACQRTYAPYSKFAVGAAISLSNGEIVSGSNQENVAYPSGMCAERVACFYAHSQHPEAQFKTIAIAACDADGKGTQLPISPCGNCRQALLEYETLADSDIKIILVGEKEIYILPSVKSLLPLAFSEF